MPHCWWCLAAASHSATIRSPVTSVIRMPR